jgi:hypothetical protein
MSLNANLANVFRRVTSFGRALPNAIILGAQKAGTTYLFDLLEKHPEVSASFRKEVQFFGYRYGRGMGWYRSWFPFRWQAKKVVLEGTPFYLYHPRCAERIHSHLPAARLIVLLRDPVQRAYSSYQDQCRRGAETLSFADALAKEDERTADDHQHFDDIHHPLKAVRVFSYRRYGIYHEQLARYLAVFPRESLLILRSETFFSDTKGTVARVCRHLGISEWEPPALPPSNSGGKYSSLDPKVAEELRAFYRPHNQRLYELIGEDFGW